MIGFELIFPRYILFEVIAHFKTSIIPLNPKIFIKKYIDIKKKIMKKNNDILKLGNKNFSLISFLLTLCNVNLIFSPNICPIAKKIIPMNDKKSIKLSCEYFIGEYIGYITKINR